MKFGLFYLFSDFGNIPQRQLFDEVLEEIAFGEELGFDSVWLPEHHFSVYAMLGNPLVFASAVAQRTRRMRIGTAVVLLPFQHPLRFAEDAALVDVLSNGRLMLGVGRGYQPIEFRGFGVNQAESSAMFQEGFEVLKRALSGETFAHRGKYWSFEDPVQVYPQPIQKPHPPLYLASISPRSLDVAARLGVSLLRAPQFSDLDSVATAFTDYTAKLRQHGHDPDRLDQPLSIRAYVAPTDAEARGETKHALWFYHLLGTLVPGAPGRGGPVAGYENYQLDPKKLASLTLEDVWERGTAFGSPERVTEMLKQYMRRLGTRHFIIQMRTGGLEHKKILRSMELFAKHVMPAIRAEEARLISAA